MIRTKNNKHKYSDKTDDNRGILFCRRKKNAIKITSMKRNALSKSRCKIYHIENPQSVFKF